MESIGLRLAISSMASAFVALARAALLYLPGLGAKVDVDWILPLFMSWVSQSHLAAFGVGNPIGSLLLSCSRSRLRLVQRAAGSYSWITYRIIVARLWSISNLFNRVAHSDGLGTR